MLHKDDQVEKQLAVGPSTHLDIELPLGPAYDDYQVALWVRVADTLGAVTNYYIGRVQVSGWCRDSRVWTVVVLLSLVLFILVQQ